MNELTSQDAFSPQVMCSQLTEFAGRVEQLCGLIGLDATSLELDHIAMRINQYHAAQLAHQQWADCGRVISQAQINGRPIIVIKLTQPLTIGCWVTDCVELPYPAVGKVYAEQGWEHVEFVVPCVVDNGDDFINQVKQFFPRLAENWPQLAELGVTIKVSSPQGEGERLANPTIAFKWQQVCIKLHPHSLEAVIASEQQ
jgi:predicted metalloenzyme YecM